MMASRELSVLLNFITPTSKINRRYVAPNEALNTGSFEEKPVTIRDARTEKGKYTLDTSGFALADHETKVDTIPATINQGNGFPRQVTNRRDLHPGN
jgi:hypothetical protein